MSEYLFSYGTLQQEKTQLELFGRKLHGTSDVLKGYKVATIEIKDETFLTRGEEKFQKTPKTETTHTALRIFPSRDFAQPAPNSIFPNPRKQSSTQFPNSPNQRKGMYLMERNPVRAWS